jgi:hypothetical protein
MGDVGERLTETRGLKNKAGRVAYVLRARIIAVKMTEKIFFFHNPKAGGYSLRKVFESHFPTETQCPIIENDKVGHEQLSGEYARFRGYDYYGRDIFEAVNDGHWCVTNFRNPLARLISLYNYFRFDVKSSDEELRTERFHAVAFAKSVSFEEFVSSGDPHIDVYVRNAHFRQLANSCWALETTKEFDDVCRFVDEMRCTTSVNIRKCRSRGCGAYFIGTWTRSPERTSLGLKATG